MKNGLEITKDIVEFIEEIIRERNLNNFNLNIDSQCSKKKRLPCKLADCVRIETELFIVEGDSAGGSANKQERILASNLAIIRLLRLNLSQY